MSVATSGDFHLALIPAYRCAHAGYLHWVMDMVLRDECRVRTHNAPANFAICRHIAYNLTRNLPGKDSIRLRRKSAGWDDEYLVKVIAA